MSVQINGTNGLTFNDGSSQQTAASGFGFKNRIINGAMMIDQRNAGASVTPTTDTYTLDRWRFGVSQSSKFSTQQNAGSVTPPIGFTNYLGVTSLSSYSITSTDIFGLYQRIEGYNIADLAWGTANAKTVMLSFQVYSSLTGTFGGSLQNSAGDRTYPFTYAIASANTWTPISVPIAGCPDGTWLTNSSTGIKVTFGLGLGSTVTAAAGSWTSTTGLWGANGCVSVVGTNGATFYITGVQLEKGSTATSFDYRPYGTELALCQRYCPVYYIEQGNFVSMANTATSVGAVIPISQQPRVVPSGSTVVGSWNTNTSATQDAVTSTSFQSYGGGFYIGFSIATPRFTANNAVIISANTGSKIIFNGCEL